MKIYGVARIDTELLKSELMKNKDVVITEAKKRIAIEIGDYLVDHLELITFEETKEDTPYTMMMKGHINII